MTISCTFANAEETQVLFTDNRGDTYTVPVGWPGRFREEENDGGGVVGYLVREEVIGAYVAPEPIPFVPHLNNGGLVRFSGAAPVEVHENVRLGAVTRVSKGRWRTALIEAIPTGFSTWPSYIDANPRTVWVSAITSTYVEVRARDLAGAAADCLQVIVKIERVVTQ